MMVRFWVMRLVRLLYCPAAVQSRISSSTCANPWETLPGSLVGPAFGDCFSQQTSVCNVGFSSCPLQSSTVGECSAGVCAGFFS